MPDWYNKLNGLEKKYCILNPLNWGVCYKAFKHAEVAYAEAEKKFAKNTLEDGKGDAFRHCYWNARMAIDIGFQRAKTIADNHENGIQIKDADKKGKQKRAMDLKNNDFGRKIGISFQRSAPKLGKNKWYAQSMTRCGEAARNGELKTLV